MAERRRLWGVLGLLAVMLAAGAGRAAGQDGTLIAKLTDLHSAPVGGAEVVLRNLATGAEVRLVTERNGSFHVSGLAPGAYALEATRAGLGRGQLEELVVPDTKPAKVQIALLFGPVPKEEAGARTKFWEGWVRPEIRCDEARVDLAIPAEGVSGLRLPGEPIWAARRTGPEVRGAVVAVGVEKIPVAALPLEGHAVAGLGGAGAVQAPAAPLAEDGRGSAPGALVSTTEVQELPAAGRRWQDFLPEVAGTTVAGAQAGTTEQAGSALAETSLDGMGTQLRFGVAGRTDRDWMEAGGEGGRGQGGVSGSWSNGSGSAVAEAAIRAVRTEVGSVEAEAGRGAGGRVAIETAGGRNGLHGQGFVFDRQNTWGARNPYTEWITQTAPGTETTVPVFGNGPGGAAEPYTPPDHETVWGLGAGSQIRRDKLFWFGALDSYRRNDPGIATVRHPYLLETPNNCPSVPCTPVTQGFFAQPTNDQMQVLSARLGLSAANPVAEGLAAYSQMLQTLDGLLGPAARRTAQWVGFGRLDWKAAERHRVSVEGTGGHWDAPGGGVTRVSAPYGANSFGNGRASDEMVMGRWEAFLTPNLLAVSEGSAGRSILGTHAETPSAFEKTLLAPNTWGQLPQMVVDSRYGFTIGNPSRFGMGSYPDEHTYHAREGVDWVRGRLLVRSGFQFEHNADATSLLRNETGTYSYASVENFASDALAFAQFGVSGQLNPENQHNCDATGKVWRDTQGTLRGLGYLPCYSYYSQVMGPAQWNLSTNEFAGFSTAQWRVQKLVVISGGMRWEREQLPPPIAAVRNPDLPLTEKLPSLGNDWGPRVSLAVGSAESHAPVLRVGYGMYFGRTENATVETALSQTGSAAGDMSFFLRPTDNLHSGGAPPFPMVLNGQPGSMVKPGAVEFAPTFRLPEVHQAVAALEESLPGHWQVTASGVVSLGRRLPISIDTNFDPALNPGNITYAVVDGTGAGPIKSPRITVPFFASWPSAASSTGFAGRANANYQQISQIMSRANSTYEAAMLRVARYGRRGLSVHAQYTYGHAMDWNPNETTTVAGSDVLDPENFSQEYGTSDLDVRHMVNGMVMMEGPWKLRGALGRVANGWKLSTIGHYRSGMPFTMRTAGSLAEEFETTTGAAVVGLGPGMNGSGGDNRVIGVGRNTYRYPATWKADVRLGKTIDFGALRQLELLVESFNLFNHQNVTELETTGYFVEPGSPDGTLPTLNFLNGLKANTTAFGAPLDVNATNFYRERQIQVGMRMRF